MKKKYCLECYRTNMDAKTTKCKCGNKSLCIFISKRHSKKDTEEWETFKRLECNDSFIGASEG